MKLKEGDVVVDQWGQIGIVISPYWLKSSNGQSALAKVKTGEEDFEVYIYLRKNLTKIGRL
jgi:hypothetical protein